MKMTLMCRLLASGAALVVMATASPSLAQARSFNIPAQSAVDAIPAFARQAGIQIIVPSSKLRGMKSPALRGEQDVRQALRRLIGPMGLEIASDNGSTIVLRPALRAAPTPAPSPGAKQPAASQRLRPVAAAAPSAEADIQDPPRLSDIIVTARRKEEKIIDVPAAVSVFSAKRLDDLKIEGGPELLRAVPNVSFSKDNFSGYNFEIRGVGTKTVSTTADPSVAVDFNNSTLLRNRLFEQEYFDVSRVEVLRGPQGTLYGRNATAGVVNMLPNLPELEKRSGDLQVEAGNYSSYRARGYLNIPLGDTIAVRAAGAYTKRDGFDYNTVTEDRVNGRDLYSIRGSVLWKPSSRLQANFIWEHFNEHDNRSRTGKQLCTRGEAPPSVSYTDLDGNPQTVPVKAVFTKAATTPGCEAKSLFTDAAYGTPNGIGFPINVPLITFTPFATAGGPTKDKYLFPAQIDPFTPAGSTEQSHDLRQIATFYDPVFRAKNDIFQFNAQWQPDDSVTLFSQTLYTKDSYYASEDFFRSTSASGLMANPTGRSITPTWAPYLGVSAAGNGAFIDPQLGLLDHLAAIDISESNSEQWSQEVRLQSSFDGPFNFTLGGNYLHFQTDESYWVFSNAFTIAALSQDVSAGGWRPDCTGTISGAAGDPTKCTYVDPNPLGSLDNQGHNYYRNRNIASTDSMGIFGEGYLEVTNNLRLTGGLRLTKDVKRTTPISTQLLTSNTATGGGTVGKGYPERPETKQSWRALTGRFVVDWKPDVSFTDDTLIYASYSRGYKAGGGNPAGPDLNDRNSHYTFLPTTYDPEFVNAFEIGMKNAFDHGRMTLNVTGFLYDYKNYQISQLIDEAVHTENFNALSYGLEFEGAWAPNRHFRLDATMGLLKTRVADGETSIDIMNRTQGRSDYYVVRPWPSSPTTCIVPAQILGRYIKNLDTNPNGSIVVRSLCPGPSISIGGFLPGSLLGLAGGDKDALGHPIPSRGLFYDPNTWVDPVTGKSINGGRGFSADLSGNELPNAPRLTFNIGAQYGIDLPGSWEMTLRGDYYHQSQSFMRIYDSAYDQLKGWGNANITVTVSNPPAGVTVQFYIKNLINSTPITDGFTGPDELGNYTNVFTLDPRIFGMSLRKKL